MNMQAQNTDQLHTRISSLEQKLKQLEGKKTNEVGKNGLNMVSWGSGLNHVFFKGHNQEFYHK